MAWQRAVVPAAQATYHYTLSPIGRAAKAVSLTLYWRLLLPAWRVVLGTPAAVHAYVIQPCTVAATRVGQALAKAATVTVRATARVAGATWSYVLVPGWRGLEWVFTESAWLVWQGLWACATLAVRCVREAGRLVAMLVWTINAYLLEPACSAALAVHSNVLVPTAMAAMRVAKGAYTHVLLPAAFASARTGRAAALAAWRGALATTQAMAFVAQRVAVAAKWLVDRMGEAVWWAGARVFHVMRWLTGAVLWALDKAEHAARWCGRKAQQGAALAMDYFILPAAGLLEEALHMILSIALDAVQATRQHVVPLGWPAGAAVATWMFARQALQQRQVFPFAPAAYCCAVTTVLMLSKALKRVTVGAGQGAVAGEGRVWCWGRVRWVRWGRRGCCLSLVCRG